MTYGHQSERLGGGNAEIARTWPLTLGVFALFRFFDVVKPWPVRQSQALPGGWGITVDDALAAVYVNGVVLAVHAVAKGLGW